MPEPSKPKHDVWLETPEGIEVPILGACFLGRASVNTLVLHDNRVSARHAMIHSPVSGEYWVIDLGSRNGTLVNGRLISQPHRLADHDRIELPGCCLLFRQARRTPVHDATTPSAEETIQDVQTVEGWLLVADMSATSSQPSTFWMS